MNWQILVTKSAAKQTKHFPKKDFVRIGEAIDEMATNPFLGDVQKIGGEENTWRRRVGNYRIKYIVKVDKRLVYIFDIKRRTSSTY